MNIQALVRSFHLCMGCRTEEQWTTELGTERWALIAEEFAELRAELVDADGRALDDVDLRRLAKETADLVYVLYGLAVNLGFDLDAAVRIVHESNMTKLDAGRPVVGALGKIMKGPNYQPPDMTSAMPRWSS